MKNYHQKNYHRKFSEYIVRESEGFTQTFHGKRAALRHIKRYGGRIVVKNSVKVKDS